MPEPPDPFFDELKRNAIESIKHCNPAAIIDIDKVAAQIDARIAAVGGIDAAKAMHARLRAAVQEGIWSSEHEPTYSYEEVWAEVQARIDAIAKSRDENGQR